GSGIWAPPFCVFDTRAGNNLTDDLCQLSDAVIFLVLANVERLVVDGFTRGLQCRQECPRNILDVDATRGMGPRHEIVQYEVETMAGRNAVGCGIAQKRRAEVVTS